MNELPESAYPRCLRCGGLATGSRVLHEVVGYTRARSAGGANHIVARRETGRVVCADCALRVQAGTEEGQEALL